MGYLLDLLNGKTCEPKGRVRVSPDLTPFMDMGGT